MEILNLRTINNLESIAEQLNNDEAKQAGIYLNEAELRYYQATPWIEAFVLIEKGKVAGFASVSFSEKAWGRGQWSEFYLIPEYRHKLSGYRFYKSILKVFEGCHRICAHVRASNTPMYILLVKLGWKVECVIRRYDRGGKSYYQLAYSRGAKE